MTPSEVRSIRHQLGLTQAGLAQLLRLSTARGGRSIREYELGERTPSGPVTLALEALRDGWRPEQRETNR